MVSPKFNPQDKIIYIGPKSARYNTTEAPITYIVNGFSSKLHVYYVYTPGYKARVVPIVLTQYDLELNFRLADTWEIETYFE